MPFPDGRNNSNNRNFQCSAVVTSQTVYTDGEAVTLYGIRVFSENKLAAEYTDITEKQEKIKELCALFNKNDIDRKHIDDIIEDFADSLHFFPQE